MDSIILVANPGSASRKYAIYRNRELTGDLHFEFEKGEVVCTVTAAGQSQKMKTGAKNFDLAVKLLLKLAYQAKLIEPAEKIAAIGVRLVAPGDFFTGDHLVNQVFLNELEKVRASAPLHVETVLKEIYELKRLFKGTKVVAVSDSAYHRTMWPIYQGYGISTKVAVEFNVKRYGYHGISLASVTGKLTRDRRYRRLKKVVVAHLGSGCSVTAVENWQSVNTSMGYSPLEGLMGATRSGSIDFSAALRIKRGLGLTDALVEEYLNRQSGLMAVSDKSDDFRELLKLEKKGDARAKFTIDMWASRVAEEIGRMIVSLEGCSALVFTGTIGQRSAVLRRRILERLEFLGFYPRIRKNAAARNPKEIVDISNHNGILILVVPTNENAEIARRASEMVSA
jgi:acetate kinase